MGRHAIACQRRSLWPFFAPSELFCDKFGSTRVCVCVFGQKDDKLGICLCMLGIGRTMLSPLAATPTAHLPSWRMIIMQLHFEFLRYVILLHLVCRRRRSGPGYDYNLKSPVFLARHSRVGTENALYAHMHMRRPTDRPTDRTYCVAHACSRIARTIMFII